MNRIPRAILLLAAAAWAVRALVIAVSPFYGFDERFAVEAAKYPVSSRFVSGMSMPERWIEVRRLSTGDRPLWTLAHLLFGSLVPSGGSAAFLLSLLASGVALLALAGAARRIGGSRQAAAVIAFVSLSPLALHYSTSVLAPPISAMWICLAIFALSSPRWALLDWAAGGLCLGLGFGTHMGAGAPIFGIGAAAAFSAIAATRSPGLPPRERARRGFLCPLAGAAGAAAPLLMLEAWARSAHDTYLGRLRHHENLNYEGVGPFGLWIRQLFELDPMVEILALLLLVALARRARPGPARNAARAGAVVLAGVLLVSLKNAPPRAAVSVLVFLGIAAAIGAAAGLVSGSFRSPPPAEAGGAAPLTHGTVLLAAAVTAVLLTLWRSVSCMPRLTFAAWPLFALALTGGAVRILAPRGSGPRLGRLLAGLAAVLAALGAFAVLRLRGIEARSSAAASRQPGWVKLVYEDFWAYDDRQRAFGWLATRGSFDAEVIAPPGELYPIAAYEEEPYKLLFFRDTIRDFQLGRMVPWIDAPWAVYYFDPGPTVPPEVAAARRPPRSPGTGSLPEEIP